MQEDLNPIHRPRNHTKDGSKVVKQYCDGVWEEGSGVDCERIFMLAPLVTTHRKCGRLWAFIGKVWDLFHPAFRRRRNFQKKHLQFMGNKHYAKFLTFPVGKSPPSYAISRQKYANAASPGLQVASGLVLCRRNSSTSCRGQKGSKGGAFSASWCCCCRDRSSSSRSRMVAEAW